MIGIGVEDESIPVGLRCRAVRLVAAEVEGVGAACDGTSRRRAWHIAVPACVG